MSSKGATVLGAAFAHCVPVRRSGTPWTHMAGSKQSRRRWRRRGPDPVRVAKVCPCSAFNANEEKLAAERFNGQPHHRRIDLFLSTCAGYVQEDEYGASRTSEGMCSWVLFRRKLLDRSASDCGVELTGRLSKVHKRICEYRVKLTAEMGLARKTHRREVPGKGIGVAVSVASRPFFPPTKRSG